jgi:hypothetical protein
MLADPILTPVTCGCIAGDVAPAPTKTLDGATVAIALLLLESATVTPPAGAALDSVMGKTADLPIATLIEAGTPMAAVRATVTVTVAFCMPATLAVIVEDPAAAAVTGTLIAVVFATMVTFAGTVATDALDELRLTLSAVARGADSMRVTFCVPAPLNANTAGEKLMVGVGVDPTTTFPVTDWNPNEDTVIAADPFATPTIVGVWYTGGAVAPCGMKRVFGDTVTLLVSLLATDR